MVFNFDKQIKASVKSENPVSVDNQSALESIPIDMNKGLIFQDIRKILFRTRLL